MNPLAVAVLAYVLIGLDLALAETVRIGPCAPRLVLPLLVLVAMYAPARAATWAGLAAGLMVDLLSPIAVRSTLGGAGGVGESGTLWLVGPSALGYAVGMYAVVVLRGYMIKRSPGTPPALTLVAGVVAAVVGVALISVRYQVHVTVKSSEAAGWAWRAGPELLARLGSAVYTSAVAIPLCMALRPLTRVLGLDDSPHRRRGGA